MTERAARKCGKCGEVRIAEMTDSAACTGCGAIYAKVSLGAPQGAPHGARVHNRVQRGRSFDRHAEGDVAAFARAIARLLWAGCLIGSAVGVAQLIIMATQAQSAPQQTAGSVMAIATGLIPAVAAYAVDRMIELDERSANFRVCIVGGAGVLIGALSLMVPA